MEFGGNYKLLSNQVNIRFGGTVAEHTYIDFKVSDYPTDVLKNLDGKKWPQAPRWSGNSEISYYPNWLPKFRTSVECQSVGSYYQDQINTIKICWLRHFLISEQVTNGKGSKSMAISSTLLTNYMPTMFREEI